jgi:hypothetical protein
VPSGDTKPKELSPAELARRLAALEASLGRFPAGLVCPWPLARVFNELLRRARELKPADPLLKGIAFVKERESDIEEGGSNALVGTVEGLAAQVATALDPKTGAGRRAARS